jgi:branched-chain amino acid transport system substrate-binding protein
VRAGFTVPQITAPIGQWAAKNGIKRVVCSVTDYAPGLECEKTFIRFFTEGGGTIVESMRTPLQNPDYAPFLQRAKDAKPDAMFIFVPSGQGAAIMKQFVDRGLKDAGIKLIGTGDILDDDLLEAIGPPALGAITSHHYSAAHDSPENKAYVDAFMKANNGKRPNFMSVNGYDGMHVVYETLKKTGGNGTGEALVEAAKGLSWVSPRGPMSIDPTTRDVVQNIYIPLRDEGRQALNVEFDKVENVKDRLMTARKNPLSRDHVGSFLRRSVIDAREAQEGRDPRLSSQVEMIDREIVKFRKAWAARHHRREFRREYFHIDFLSS